MAKKKSLGSSPIGFQSDNGSMNFIPDLGVAKPKKETSKYYAQETQEKEEQNGYPKPADEVETKKSKSEKKIVSYNLEISLIERVKQLAQEKDMYYSSLVSKALKHWIAKNG